MAPRHTRLHVVIPRVKTWPGKAVETTGSSKHTPVPLGYQILERVFLQLISELVPKLIILETVCRCLPTWRDPLEDNDIPPLKSAVKFLRGSDAIVVHSRAFTWFWHTIIRQMLLSPQRWQAACWTR